MPILSVFFAVLLSLGLFFMQNQHRLQANALTGEAAAITGNMRVYRNAVGNYARTHTFVTGAVADTALELPVWFRHRPDVQNYVVDGQGYVYFSPAQPELVTMLLKASEYAVLAGINQGGWLYNPISGITSVRLPIQVPEGSVVYADG
ncbi:Type IV pilus protein PilM [Candidatus Glomeribacter gigasporarum BEG34]|uniref:Type IV pilus protein PilM n=1 Tax=Candidatus Glomeribacter gigasporarum BEG34 TaxID=1070319 RepID=G2J988_9BURK|nr:type IV pilus biogenesis protein PilM [Candidatus Glomeribacter gigasporarum]CCD29335.1 Type IV pilus protein PilM [Candidatus Glomeribacter gigasporarum BEG34]